MDFLSFVSKHSSGKLYRKFLVLFGFIFLACAGLSCNWGKDKRPDVTENLYVLYLNNTPGNPELQRLLSNTKTKRVVFQFFHDESGILDLDAWPQKDTSGESAVKYSILLHETSILKASIVGMGVHLGNVHIRKSGYNSLLKFVNKPGSEYIIFVPDIQHDTVKGINHIIYHIYGQSSLSEQTVAAPPVADTSSLTPVSSSPASPPVVGSSAPTSEITNTSDPSPPRPAN